MPHKKIALAVLLGIIIVYGAYVVWIKYRAEQTINTIQALIEEKQEQLAIVPIERTIATTPKPISSALGGFKNASFTIPFTPSHTRDGKEHSVVYNEEITKKALAFMESITPLPEKFLLYHGFTSHYEAYDAILRITPAAVNSPEHSKQEKTRLETLALMKGPLTVPDTPIYAFSVNTIRGFQFGDPGSGEIVTLEIFDQQDKQYTLIPGNLSQAEIDLVLQSLTFKTE